MKGLLFFMKYCWKNNKRFVIYTFSFQFFSSLIPLTVVVFPKFIIDELMGEKRMEVLTLWTLLLVGYSFFGGILANVFRVKAFIEKSKLLIKFQSDLTKKLAIADYEQIESVEFLDHKEKASKFIYGNGQGFATVFDNFGIIIGQVFIFIGIITILSTLNVYLLLAFILLSIVNSIFDHRSKKKFIELDMKKAPVERRTKYLIDTIESFQYGKEIRLFGLSDWFTEKVRFHLHESNEFYVKQMRDVLLVGNINLFTSFIRESLTYFFLIYQFLEGSITIGDFTMYVAAVASFSSSLKNVFESVTNLRQFEGYYDSLNAYMNIPVKSNKYNHIALPEAPFEIRFDHVYFKYPHQKSYTLSDISFSIKTTEKIAIVGENGSGKTTLVKLLCRLYEPTKGTIFINGIDINKVNHTEYIQLIATVFQDFKLFSFSLKENIVFNHGAEIEDEEVETILKRNGFGKIETLEKGINTSVYKNFDDSGFEPSGGEAQKIAMARCDFKNAAIVILDEPTAAMDPRAEYELYKRFDSLVKGKIAIFISHRLASTRFCNQLLFLKEGVLIERGSHEELLKQNGAYAELFQMQAQFYR